MKVYGIPGWACKSDYFNFIENSMTFDWCFYSNGIPKPKEFLSNINENFIFISYSLGSLFIPDAIKNKYCKGIISLSGFMAFCGEGKLNSVLQKTVTNMQAQLSDNLDDTIANFNLQAGSSPLDSSISPEYTNLNQGLDILKNHNYESFTCKTPILLIRGRKDKILHPKVAVQLEREFNEAEKYCIENAPHDISQLPEVHDYITAFIKRLS